MRGVGHSSGKGAAQHAGSPSLPNKMNSFDNESPQLNDSIVRRSSLFALLFALSLVFYWAAVKDLVALSIRTDQYSHIIFIPFLSWALVLRGRIKIFKRVYYSFCVGAGVLSVGVFMGKLIGPPLGEQKNTFALIIVSLVIIWIGAFILCYGWTAFRTGAFALTFLLLMVPLPDFLLDKVISLVRYGSAEIVSLLFGVVSVPVFREGFRFMLPNGSIEIARQCSGIHSTIALFIVTLLAGHLFLPSMLKRTLLLLSTVPIVCLTNGIRIASLTLLSVYVNKDVLSGGLHHKGGVLFFGLALVLMGCLLYLMGLGRTRSAEGVPPRSLPVAK